MPVTNTVISLKPELKVYTPNVHRQVDNFPELIIRRILRTEKVDAGL